MLKKVKSMKLKKKIILPSMLAIAVLAVGILAANPVLAQTSSGYQTLVQEIADNFGLPEAEVRDVLDDYRDERKANIYAMVAERLNELELDGVITESQKDAILDKHEETQNKIEELKHLSLAKKKARLYELRKELKTWATQNDIDFSLFKPFSVGLGRRLYKVFLIGVTR